jgi:hypothetical protein
MRCARTLLLFPLLPLLITCSTPRTTVNNDAVPTKDPRWGEVDSLANIGQYASALERTNILMGEAQRDNDWRKEYRAWAYSGTFKMRTGGDKDSSLLELEQRAATATTPLKQLLYSAVAEGWWNRYQQDRWRILERTNMAVAGDDPATWTQATFIQKVIDAYALSLAPKEAAICW